MKSVRYGLLFLAVLLSGCAVLGRQQNEHPIDQLKVRQVKKGMSRQQVTALLGAPQEIQYSNKEHDPLWEHAYVYEHTQTVYTGIVFGFINFGNVDEKRDRVIVFFDEEGRVEHIGSSLFADEASFGFPFGS